MLSSADRRRLFHQLLRAAILSGFAMYIIYLVRTDSLTLYIAPRMVIYVKLSAMGLYATAIYQVYTAFQTWKGKDIINCDCNHEPSSSVTKNTLIYGLFILPIALGFLLPDGMLGNNIVSKKGIHLSGPESLMPIASMSPASKQPQTEAEWKALFPFDESTKANAKLGRQLYQQATIRIPEKDYVETLTTIDLYRSNFIGKTVEISGFVFREEGMSNNQFVVSRFVMNCCSADSVPYGIVINFPHAAAFKDDAWVKVSGILNESTFDGKKISVLDAQHLQIIEAPDSPYVYPDYDFDL